MTEAIPYRSVEIKEVIAIRDAAYDEGDLPTACHHAYLLGCLYRDTSQLQEAEAAFRESVMLAREMGEEFPELVLMVFANLARFLWPSKESVTLSNELTEYLDRPKTSHPMRGAEAAHLHAESMLHLARIDPQVLDEAVVAARDAISICDDWCLHYLAHSLREDVVYSLKARDRDSEASLWEAEIVRYGTWEADNKDSNRQIPGHVHLWDIRF